MYVKKTALKRRKAYIITVFTLVVVTAMAFFIIKFLPVNTAKPINTVCKEYGAPVGKQCIADYLGLTRDEAMAKAKESKLFPQVTYIDGEDQAILDIGGPVIYFEVENGAVTDGYFDRFTKDGRIQEYEK